MTKNLSPKQLNDLGDAYFYGEEEPKNLEMAFTYYKRAADLNNPIGYFNVAKYFIEKKQFKQGIEYLNKSIALGYSKAYIQLSNIYLNGLGVRKNKKKAFKNLEEAVNKHDIYALHQLGIFYLKGIGCKKSEENARKFFERSAQNNVSIGMYYLGNLYLNAKKIKKDYKNGFFWLDKAAENGSEEAIILLKELYSNHHPFLRKKSQLYLDEMLFYYDELLAKKMNVESLINVSDIYANGNKFCKVNHEKANYYYQELCKLDNTKGYLGMGLSKLYGRGMVKDYQKAREYFEIASTRKDVDALNAMGEIYRLGYGVDINYQRAKDYYFEAAKSDNTNALINLGLLNYRKQISSASFDLAFRYMKQAEEKGNKQAFYWLGIFYDKGIGTEKNYKQAEISFKKAIQSGNQGAKYKYAQMLYEHVLVLKLPKRKKNNVYLQIRDLLFDYIKSSTISSVNKMYSMYMLGDLFKLKDFDLKSTKISRYYYELAAEKGFTKAKVRLYFILKSKESKAAFNYLLDAIKNPHDGEALYEYANILLAGNEYIKQDELKAKEFYGKAASLNYQPAKEKLTML